MHSILAVDDSASMRQMVSFTLKRAGYNVVEAVDGAKTVRAIAQAPADGTTRVAVGRCATMVTPSAICA